MKFTGRDLVKLQWPLLSALALLVLAALPAWWSRHEVIAVTRERDAAAARKQLVEQRLRLVRTEEQDIKERALRFQRLQQSGIAGDEQRLEWTELLRAIQSQLRIPGLVYEFGVRKPLDSDGGPYAYFASPMRMQLRLVHEEDLLRLLDRLQREATALVLIRSCTLAPLAARGVGSADLAQLGAECELRWITVARQGQRP